MAVQPNDPHGAVPSAPGAPRPKAAGWRPGRALVGSVYAGVASAVAALCGLELWHVLGGGVAGAVGASLGAAGLTIALVYPVARAWVRNADSGGASAAWYREVFHRTDVPMALVDMNGHWLRVNHALCTFLGYSRHELLRCSLAAISHPEDYDRSHHQLERLLRGETAYYRITKRYVRKDGSVRWGSASVSRGQYPGTEQACITVAIVDITEHKRVEEELQRVHRIYRQAIECSHGVPYRLDYRTNRYEFIGDACEALLEVRAHEFVPERIDRWVIDERVLAVGVPQRLVEYALLCRAGQIKHYHVARKYRLPSGKEKWVGDHAVVLFDSESGAPHGALGILTDITAEMHLQDVLEERQARFRALVEASFEGIACVRDGTIADANTAFAQLFGLADHAVIGRPVDVVVASEHRGLLRDAVRDATSRPIELRGLRADGREFDIEVLAKPVTYGGTPATAVAFRDISERKGVEQALHDSESRLRTVMEHAPDFILEIARDGRIVYVNRTERNVAKESVVGTRLTAWIDASQSAQVAELLDHVFATGRPRQLELLARNRAGGARWYWARIGPLHVNGAVQSAILISRDITEQRAAEAQLRFQAQILENVRESIVATDLEGRITYWGRGARSLYGYAAEEVLGRSVALIVPPDDEDAEHARMRAVHETGAWQGQYWQVRKDGSRFFAETAIVLAVHPNGEPFGLIGSDRDITARKEAEDEVRRLNEELELRVAQRTRELETANRELEAFSYSISHDLRAPVRTLYGLATIIEEDFGARLPEAVQGHLVAVRQLAQEMGRLVDGLLLFSRTSRQELERRPVDMERLCREAWAALAPGLAGQSVDFTMDALPECEGDPVLLRQVWFNLLGNAVKYSAHRERPKVRVVCEWHHGEPVYAVHDNGIGLGSADITRIFDVFARAQNGMEYEGAGVGLAIVQSIVQRHGGCVWAEGLPGAGAVFRFSIGSK